VFRNNDLPGIMFGGAAQRLVHLYAVKPGTRAVILTANGEGYGVALDLIEAGIEVALICDLHAKREGDPLHEAVLARGVEVRYGEIVTEALPDASGLALGAVVVGPPAAAPAAGRRVDCDLVLTSVGFAQMGGAMRYDSALAGLRAILPGEPRTVDCAGAVNGVFDLDAAIADGHRAGWQAAYVSVGTNGPRPALPQYPAERGRNHAWPIASAARGRDFVDFDEDLQVHDLEDAVAAGYTDFDLVKRYSTVVMGPSQGRQSALNALRLVARANGRELDGLAITTQRPPVWPEPLGHLAGRPWHPVRVTPMHHLHLAQGAHMIPAGSWLRPGHYGPPGTAESASRREAHALRTRVGLIDVSTLGKIEVRGPDAAELLERFYTFRYRKQAVGKLRYVLMTDEAGIIADDGVAARFGEDFFYVSATTTGADVVYRQMLRWNAQWNLDVDLIHVTGAWAGINVAGPAARELLQPLVDVDLAAAAFAFQDCREARIDGVPARLMRVGFVGELGWEVHVPAHFGGVLWQRLLTAGAKLGVSAVGIEAQRLLRLEKGHIIVSQDTDGLTFPDEADMQWAVANEKPYFVGQRALAALARRGLTRKLVGFALPLGSAMPEECNLTMAGRDIVGRVTSVGCSAACGRIIGLAYVSPEQAAPGTVIDIKMTGRQRRLHAEVVPRPFYDPENLRQQL
jgi:sarcosine oxidase subunit alpha